MVLSGSEDVSSDMSHDIMSREVMTCVNEISLFVMTVTLYNCDTHLVIMYLLVMPIMVVMCGSAQPQPGGGCYIVTSHDWGSTFNSYIALHS